MRRVLKSFCEHIGIPGYWVSANFDELRMAMIRMYGWLPFQRARLRHLVRKGKLVNVMFGCGTTRYDGWIGVDCFFGKTVDFVLDLRRKLPFPDECAAFCYSEHFLEHLYPKEGAAHLEEVYRILRPGGVYRIAVPNGIEFVRRYLADDDEFFRLAFPWAETPMEAVYCILNWEGRHRNIFDFPTLRQMSKEAGFDDAEAKAANESDFESLRIDIAKPQRVAESLYVELRKSE